MVWIPGIRADMPSRWAEPGWLVGVAATSGMSPDWEVRTTFVRLLLTCIKDEGIYVYMYIYMTCIKDEGNMEVT